MESSSILKKKASSSLTPVEAKRTASPDSSNARNQLIISDDSQDDNSNLKQFDDATLEVRQRQKVTIPKPQKSLDFILSLPIVPGRRCTMKSLGPNMQNFKLVIIESGNTTFLAPKSNGASGKGSVSQLSLVFPRVDYTREQVEGMVPLLLRLLDRWPWANVSSSALVHFLTAHHLPNHILRYPPIGNSKTTEYNTSIICIDPNTGESNKVNLHADSSRTTSMNIPSIAPNIVFNTSKSKKNEENGPAENLVETYLKFLSSKLHLRVSTLENARQLREAYGRAYGYNEIRSRGPYNGVDMWRISKERSGTTTIWPTHQVKNDVQGSMPSIGVKSTKQVFVLPVLNAILQTWISLEDILSAWIVGCRAADAVNIIISNGGTPTDVCSCEDYEAGFHPCAKCLYVTKCTEMYKNQQGMRVCNRCSQEEKTPAKKPLADFAAYLPANIHTGHKRIFQTIYNSINVEAERCGISSEVASTRIMPAWDSIQKYALPNGEWYDAYHGVARQYVGAKETQKDPFQPSMDAIFPYTIVDGEICYHAQGNLVITSLYVNFLKYAYIPAMLVHVVRFLKSDRGAIALKEFMDEMGNVYLVGMQTPFFKKKRLEKVASTEMYAARRLEWISGIPNGKKHATMKYTRKDYIGNCSAEPSKGWVPEGYDRISALILQIEQKFSGQRLRRGPDGCPFPFHDIMPVDWSWWTCWRMIDKRICRMSWWCNKKWDLHDSIETIFIECIWQILDIKVTDGLFDLPVSIYVRHPLRFTVAHRHHGQQLRSAWTNPNPTSIEERDQTKDNMSIEACIVNWTKSDFDEDQYPAIKQDLVDNLNIPKEWYDPSLRSQEQRGTTNGPKPIFENFDNGWDNEDTSDEAVSEDEDEDEGDEIEFRYSG